MVELLQVAGSAREPTGVHTDRQGVPRVVLRVPAWERLVQLGCAEIRRYGAGTPQLTRRMLAGLDELIETLPAERTPALQRQRELLVAAVVDAAPRRTEQLISLDPDRQGFG